jgi:uncharacterized protein
VLDPVWLAFESAQPALRAMAWDLGADCPSDLHAANLFLFRRAHDYRIEAGQWICGKTYDGQSHAMAMRDLPGLEPDRLIKALEQYDCLYPIPDPWRIDLQQRFKHADCPALSWHTNPDDADYLYWREQFIDYRGPKLRKRRAQMMQLLAFQTPTASPIDSSDRSLVLQTIDRWMQQKGKRSGEADEEALIEALEDLDRYELNGTLFSIKKQPIGFVMSQRLSSAVEVVRFAKGDDDFPGIYPYMFHDLARRLPRQVRWLNFEQDMGLANFRQAKRSYSPCSLLKKWRLRLADRAPAMR